MEYRLTFKYTEKPSAVIDRLYKYALNNDQVESVPVFTYNKEMVHKIHYTLEDLHKLTDILTHYDMLTPLEETGMSPGFLKESGRMTQK
jgi:protein-tyrosine phosphatase